MFLLENQNSKLVVALGLSCLLLPVDSYAKKKRTKKRIAKKISGEIDRIENLLEDDATPKTWRMYSSLYNKQLKTKSGLSPEMLQLGAEILWRDKYTFGSVQMASEAILKSKYPLSKKLEPSWEILASGAKKRHIQSHLEELAAKIDLNGKTPAAFGNGWYYFEANGYLIQGKIDRALKTFAKLEMQSRYFMPGKFAEAMIRAQSDQPKRATTALKSIFNEEVIDQSPLPEKTLGKLKDQAQLALGRLSYQTKNFRRAIKYYRSVSREGDAFYDALFEQSWALFMAGLPNHALGVMHGAESPFFKDVYNPEVSILRAITFYWMCRYDDSRNALADFSKKYGESVEGLSEFLGRRRLTDERSYELFENFITGVSSKSLGIPRDVLGLAANKDSMLPLRDTYAGLVYESDRLEARGVFGSDKNLEPITERYSALIQDSRRKIGKQYIVELQSMRTQFEQMYDQAQFLYLELLMSEKEQLLGRTLHASSKFDKISARKNIRNWAGESVSWGGDEKNEWWSDEIGFHIYRLKPQCEAK